MNDVFISYAKEDEARAGQVSARLSAAGLRVFFAPQSLRDCAHADLLDRLAFEIQSSRVILLLWGPFVNKSEWVALELAYFTTLRTQPGSERRLAALDLGGAPVPDWLAVDAVIPPERIGDIAEILKRPEWMQRNGKSRTSDHARARIVRAVATGIDLLMGGADWRRRLRVAVPRLDGAFSLAHLRSEELRQPEVRDMLADVWMFVSLHTTAAMIAAFLISAFVRFPVDYRGYVPKELLLTGCTAVAGGAVFMLRAGIALGAIVPVVSVPLGLAVVLAAPWFGRPDWTGGATAGFVIGIAAAIRSVSATAETRWRPQPLTWKPAAGIVGSFALVVVARIVATWLAEKFATPSPFSRAAFGLLFGGALFTILGLAGAWFAITQKRLRLWHSGARFGVIVSATLAAICGLVAAGVPFGNPFAMVDGIGVGLLCGGAVAGIATLLLHFLEPLTGCRWSLATAAILILSAGLPVLRCFPNIRAGSIYAAMSAASVSSFAGVRWWFQRRMVSASPAESDVLMDTSRCALG